MADSYRESNYSTLEVSSSIRKDETLFKRFFRHLDWGLMAAVLALSLLGMTMIYSASSRFGNPEYYLIKQCSAFVAGFVLLILFATINYQIFAQNLWTVFAISLSLLLVVLVVGYTTHGAKSWISLGPVMLQPAEISKLLAILVLASWCEKHQRDMRRIKGWLPAVGIVLAHIVLILLQPDLGSTLVYFPMLIAILFVGGAPSEILVPALSFSILSASLILLNVFLSLAPETLEPHSLGLYLFRAFQFGKETIVLFLAIASVFAAAFWFLKKIRLRVSAWTAAGLFFLLSISWVTGALFVHSLKEYQMKRLVVFFNPQVDPMGSGYHVIQSIIALGSGKIVGKGLFSGTQGQLGFLPEQHTDFIFSVLGEELGFVVSNIVILLYAFLVWRALRIAAGARDLFGTLVALGIGTMFAFYAILNLAMVMGFAPVTGLPLPFFSYGGSSLLSSLAAVGILLSIHIRRYMY